MGESLVRRRIEPELLDQLSTDDPKAVGSRRDLARVNALMFQPRIMAGLLRASAPPGPIRMLEIGAGDGAFSFAVARLLGRTRRGSTLLMLDQVDLLTSRRRAQFAQRGWEVETVTADLFAWIAEPRTASFDVVSANLFLHHFTDAKLAELFSVASALAPSFVATEPHRNRFALACTALLRAVGANSVTLHDSAASVRAGFRAGELSTLWPRPAEYTLDERRLGPFTHIFAAAKTAPAQ